MERKNVLAEQFKKSNKGKIIIIIIIIIIKLNVIFDTPLPLIESNIVSVCRSLPLFHRDYGKSPPPPPNPGTGFESQCQQSPSIQGAP